MYVLISHFFMATITTWSSVAAELFFFSFQDILIYHNLMNIKSLYENAEAVLT